MTLPPFVDTLRTELERSDPKFQWIEPANRDAFSNLLADGFDAHPFADSFQAEGSARISRSIPLFSGPTRPVRLTSLARASTLLFDPDRPGKVVLALGPNLPPQLWPEAEATPEGIKRDFAAYLERPFRSVHRLTRSVRVARGTLEELGIDSIEMLSRIIGNTESWTDGAATWSSNSVEDPWPEDTSTASMISLRVTQDRASEDHPNRRPSISMRTLWSRSVITIEANPFGHLVFELKFDPAPRLPTWPIPDACVPEGIPVDVLASILRGGAVLATEVAEMKKGPITPYLALMSCLLEPAETTTFDLLRTMLRDPELQEPAVTLASAFGARALLYELECESTDETVLTQLREINTLSPPSTEREDGGEEDDDGDEELDDEDDDDLDNDEDEEETP